MVVVFSSFLLVVGLEVKQVPIELGETPFEP
jgi:hypothetical protein